jgi:hypothetical protein
MLLPCNRKYRFVACNLKLSVETFDWLFIKTSDRVFGGSEDPGKLTAMLTILLDKIVPRFADPDFHYEVYVSLIEGSTKIWRPLKARMLTEDTLQISQVPGLTYCDIQTLSLDDIKFDWNCNSLVEDF